MAVDEGSRTLVIAAPFDTVMATLRDPVSQVEWSPAIKGAELLEEYEDGTPATASFEANTVLGTDRYTLEYENGDDTLAWTMRGTSRMQRRQEGQYTVRDLGDGRSEVTFQLLIDSTVPSPGFVRRKIMKDILEGTVAGLKDYCEALA